MEVNMNRRISRKCFVLLYDVLGIIVNIWHWIRIMRQSKFIIPRCSYYFEFIVFVLLSYIFPRVISEKSFKSNMFAQVFRFNLCEKLWINLCGSFVVCFPCSWTSFPCLYLDNNSIILFFIISLAKSSLCFMRK